MGYETDYNGEIHLKSKKAIKIIKGMIDKEEHPFEWCDNEIEIQEENPKDITLNISTYWKDYDNLMLKLCLFVATIDKKSHGVIECNGEDRDDVWRIIVRKGKAIREQGYIKYRNGEDFNDLEIKKKVYELTKDKMLLKELIVESLQDGKTI